MKIKWINQGRLLEHGILTIPIPEDIELDKFWDGYKANVSAYIDDGRLFIRVKRKLKKEDSND